jgi:hypothetical protein
MGIRNRQGFCDDEQTRSPRIHPRDKNLRIARTVDIPYGLCRRFQTESLPARQPFLLPGNPLDFCPLVADYGRHSHAAKER